MLVLIMLWLGYKEIKSHLEQTQAVFVLGGSTQREKFAAEFASQYPDTRLDFWRYPKDYAEQVFAKAGLTAVA